MISDHAFAVSHFHASYFVKMRFHLVRINAVFRLKPYWVQATAPERFAFRAPVGHRPAARPLNARKAATGVAHAPPHERGLDEIRGIGDRRP
ncbi:MAG: hypothetical protein ACOVOG_18820, partial [Rubrivivax sp.]